MVVYLVGAGAVGLSVAYKLYNHSEFALIVDEERKTRYSEGLKYNGSRLDVRLISPGEDAKKADLIIIAVKNFSLSEILDEIYPFVKEDTVLLPLLNGIEAEGVLEERFGSDKVLYGFITSLSSNHSGLETNCFSDGGVIVFNEKDNHETERLKKIEKLFLESGQRYRIPENILHEKWWKFMLNTCYNTLSAILFSDYSQIHDNPDFIRAVRMIAKEVQSVADSEGVKLTQNDIERMIATVDEHRDRGQTSMLQDVIAKRNTENKYFAGSVSKLGKKNGVPTPLTDFIYILLEAKRVSYDRS